MPKDWASFCLAHGNTTFQASVHDRVTPDCPVTSLLVNFRRVLNGLQLRESRQLSHSCNGKARINWSAMLGAKMRSRDLETLGNSLKFHMDLINKTSTTLR